MLRTKVVDILKQILYQIYVYDFWLIKATTFLSVHFQDSKGLGKWSERSLIMSILSYDLCCGVKIELFTCNHIARLKPHPSLPLDGERELNFTESFIIQSSLIKRGKHSALVLQTINRRLAMFSQSQRRPCLNSVLNVQLQVGTFNPFQPGKGPSRGLLCDYENRWFNCSSTRHPHTDWLEIMKGEW